MIDKNFTKKDLFIYGINYVLGGFFIVYMAVNTVKPNIFAVVNIAMVFIGFNIFFNGVNCLVRYFKFDKVHSNKINEKE